MTDEIQDYFKVGLVIPTYEATRNFNIWKHVAEEAAFLGTCNKDVRMLYSFIQASAQNNLVLCLGKLYDTPNKKYPTRCIRSFLELVLAADHASVKIEEDTNTIRTLQSFNCPQVLIDAVASEDPTIFPQVFAEYYSAKMNDTVFKSDIDTLRVMRDKYVAHNEAVATDASLEHDVIHRLIGFSNEIISVYGIAYRSEGWNRDKKSTISIDAGRNAAFVRSNLSRLKN